MKKIYPLFIFLLSLSFGSYSQESEVNETIERIIEELAANSEDNVDLTELSDYLQQISESPLNINTASAEDFEQLIFLSDRQIETLLWARRRYGGFLSIYELLYLNGFTKQDVLMLEPFFYFEIKARKRKINYSKALEYSRNQLFLRYQRVLEQPEGYKDISEAELEENPNSRYLGDRNKLYARYQYQFYNKIQAGFTAEKDAGEQYFSGEQKYGFDHYSVYAQINDIGKMHHLIVGDYQASFGQGLTAWSGFGTGKSSYVLNTRKKERGLSKYASTDENRFLRGAAAQFRFWKLKINAFASYKKRDASVDTVSTNENDNPILLSFQNTGFHRKPSENEKRKAIGESTIGTNVKFQHKTLAVGLTGIYYRFSLPQTPSDDLYAFYRESEQSNGNLSVDYDWRVGLHRFYGETAISQNGAWATINGANLHLNKNVEFAVLHRYFDKRYQAFYSNAFRENTYVQNEQGLYFGVEIHPAPKWRLAAFADSYYFPWLSYSNSAPLRGKEYFAEIEFAPKKNIVTYLRFRTETKGENISSSENSITQTTDKQRWTARWHISYRINDQLRFKNRIEWSSYKKADVSENGFMAYQDIDYSFKSIPIALNFRFALFETTYNTRLYAYEDDILYAFSVPAYNGHGYRTYMNLRYDITPKIKAWLKFGTWVLTDRESIGSGLDEIDGSSKSEIKVQFRFKF